MAKLEIQTGVDNEILRARAVGVSSFDKKLKKLVKDMKETMLAADGIGLAAPQVGVGLRVFIMILGWRSEDERIIEMVNPVILSHSEEVELGEEGCLSVPGKYGKVERFKSVVVEFYDAKGVKKVLELSGLDAREVQHENDHLDGVLFVDKLKGEEEDGKVM